MRDAFRSFPCAVLAAALLAGAAAPTAAQTARVASPNGRNQVAVEVREGRLTYSLTRDGRKLILPSVLGFEFRGAPRLRDGLRITDTTRQAHDETWTQPWGEVARVRDHHNELAVGVEETNAPNRRFTLRVRVFDDLQQRAAQLVDVCVVAGGVPQSVDEVLEVGHQGANEERFVEPGVDDALK